MEKFDPSNPEYVSTNDLPEDQREHFKDVEGNGFVRREAFDAHEEAKEDAESKNSKRGLVDKILGRNKTDALESLHDEALREDMMFELEDVLIKYRDADFDTKAKMWADIKSIDTYPNSEGAREMLESEYPGFGIREIHTLVRYMESMSFEKPGMYKEVKESRSFDQLYGILKKIGTITSGSRSLPYDEVIKDIEGVRSHAQGLTFVTSAYGIRRKVRDLLANNA